MKPVYINACEAYVPEQVETVDEALAKMKYEEQEAERDQYTSVATEQKLWPADMALLAAKATLESADVAASDISFITYSYLHRQGHKNFWQPAAYIQHQLAADNALSTSVVHGCNGMMLATGISLDHLAANEEATALVISGDRFANSAFCRWQSDYGLVYGDAAVATILSNKPGLFKVLHFQQKSAAELEAMHRMTQPSPESDETITSAHNVKEAKKSYMSQHGKARFFEVMQKTLDELRDGLISHTVLKHQLADWLILPHLGKGILSPLYEPTFNDLAISDTWEFGRTVGHTGAADQYVSLSYLLKHEQLRQGELILLVGAGAGFSCSVMLLEVCEDILPAAS